MLVRLLDEAEARQLPALIPEWSERSDALHWIARALQLDLPLLIERPELVLPCLYRRCTWLGDTSFYPKRGPVPLESENVASMIAAWIEARPMRWLRAVRPPRFSLDAAVIEEYRTTLKGDVRFSADGQLIGVIGENATVGWERVTGRKIDVRGRLSIPVAGWKHERAQGRLTLHSEGRRWDLAVDEVERVSGSFDLGDELVLVQAWYEPDPYDDATTYVLYLVDAAAGEVRWRVEGNCRHAIRIGEVIHLLGDGYLQRSLATGVELARRAFPYTSSVAFAPNGKLIATRDESVIRVWDLDQLDSHVVACRVIGGELSPDGTRVLAGSFLCDARTGAIIADLPFAGRGGGWLEGGPPANAWALVDNVVVEVLWHTTVWDSTDGRRLFQHEELHASASGAVCHDPRGRYIAMCKHEQVSAYDLRTGATLFETPAAVVERGFRDRWFGFSETGHELWWQTADRRFTVSTDTWLGIRVERRPPDPDVEKRGDLEIVDGLLVVGDVAAPMDSKSVRLSRDGRVFVGADHYVLEG